MKVAFVAQPFDVVPPAYNSSIAIWIDELSSRLTDQHEVTVFSRKTPYFADVTHHNQVTHIRQSVFIDELIRKGVKAIELLVHKVVKSQPPLFYKFYYFQWYYYFFYIVAIAQKIRKANIDVVIVPNFSQFIPIIKFFNKHTKIALMMQCDWLIELNQQQIGQRLRGADAIMGCSNYIINGVKNRFPAVQERCYTLYNGSSQEVFNTEKVTAENIRQIKQTLELTDEKVILFVGRITPEKGVHMLIEAMKRLLAAEENCHLLLIGAFSRQPPSPSWIYNQNGASQEFEQLKSQDYERYVKELAQPIAHKVTFVGVVSHYDLPAYYSLSDIFVHPSLWPEPFGMILTEAMSCQRPVVSTQMGGIPEIIVPQKTGLLAAPEAQSLADAILQLLKDDALRQEMGRAGKQRVEQEFSWDRTAQTLLQVLDRLQPETS